MGHIRYTFIEPNRPDPVPLRETLLASLAATVTAPTDNLAMASAISVSEYAIGDAVSALIDAETPAEEAPALGELKKHALLIVALVASYEAQS